MEVRCRESNKDVIYMKGNRASLISTLVHSALILSNSIKLHYTSNLILFNFNQLYGALTSPVVSLFL
jgi:hypothetical protein